MKDSNFQRLCAATAVDNIPGVRGVGAKTAAALLSYFGSSGTLFDRIDEVAFLRPRGTVACAANLREHVE